MPGPRRPRGARAPVRCASVGRRKLCDLCWTSCCCLPTQRQYPLPHGGGTTRIDTNKICFSCFRIPTLLDVALLLLLLVLVARVDELVHVVLVRVVLVLILVVVLVLRRVIFFVLLIILLFLILLHLPIFVLIHLLSIALTRMTVPRVSVSFLRHPC